NGRKRVLLEMNCGEANIEQVVNLLPAMRSPTVAKLYNSNDYAVRAAVKKSEVKSLIPQLIKAGAIDILEIPIRKAI
ncbi:MAG: ATP phosphoribosyltransferase, partial [Proteobacteria bacterium]|nr:ATP phosphoribosyltransferase [Pseudomonadota bacterium]